MGTLLHITGSSGDHDDVPTSRGVGRPGGLEELPDFDIAVEAAPAATLVRVTGELDLCTAPLLESCFRDLAATHARSVTVDLAETRFIDSSGLRALVVGLRRVRADGGEMVLSSPPRAVWRALQIAGIDQVLPVTGIPDDGPAPPS